MTAKKTIAVFDPDGKYLSHCTWNRALGLLQTGRAIRLNATTIRLKQTKRQRIKEKHDIIAQSKRICYICNRVIPEDETATIDHVIPKSRDKRADVYSNMKCCCERCNNDKGNMKLSEYVAHIFRYRDKYDYISDKRLSYLKNYAKHSEEDFYNVVNVYTKDIAMPYKNTSYKKRGKRK